MRLSSCIRSFLNLFFLEPRALRSGISRALDRRMRGNKSRIYLRTQPPPLIRTTLIMRNCLESMQGYYSIAARAANCHGLTRQVCCANRSTEILSP